MPRPGTTRTKHKTLRLTERAQFAVSVFAPAQGQSGNAFISEATEGYIKVQSKKHGIDFDALWHTDECVRELRLFLLGTALDEAMSARRRFVMLHRAFFYTANGDVLTVNEHAAHELHPLLDKWSSTPGDHWAPGRAMAEHLKTRGLPQPVWPPEGEAP